LLASLNNAESHIENVLLNGAAANLFPVSNRKHPKQSKASHAGYFAGGKNCGLYNSDFKPKIEPFLFIFLFVIQTQTLI
jgi:hypothetical protein